MLSLFWKPHDQTDGVIFLLEWRDQVDIWNPQTGSDGWTTQTGMPSFALSRACIRLTDMLEVEPEKEWRIVPFVRVALQIPTDIGQREPGVCYLLEWQRKKTWWIAQAENPHFEYSKAIVRLALLRSDLGPYRMARYVRVEDSRDGTL